MVCQHMTWLCSTALEGTVQDWLQSLTGKSAYDIAKENGYSGTEQEWPLHSRLLQNRILLGIKTAAFSEKGELIITLTDERVINLGKAVGADGKDGEKGEKGDVGATGAQGEKGDTGATGAAGKDGVGVSRAYINADGQLIMEFSDGSSVNLGQGCWQHGRSWRRDFGFCYKRQRRTGIDLYKRPDCKPWKCYWSQG